MTIAFGVFHICKGYFSWFPSDEFKVYKNLILKVQMNVFLLLLNLKQKKSQEDRRLPFLISLLVPEL